MTRRLYVFDLDGTLADTEHLPSGRRMPSQLLECDPIDSDLDLDGWAYINDADVRVASLPGFLESIGHHVAIITRAPRAYASTLCGLLGVEPVKIWPSTDVDRATKLRQLAQLARVAPDDVVYVGNEDDDAEAASRAGVEFEWAQEIGDEFILPEGLPELEGEPRTVAEAAGSLLRNPYFRREEMQTFLAEKVRPEHRFCLVPADTTEPTSRGAFRYAGIRPSLFRRDEREETYFEFLRNLFPKRQAPHLNARVDENYYFVSYTKYNSYLEAEDPLGDLMRRIKDYKAQSGPNVELGSLPFVADVMGAHLAQRFARVHQVNVDHVPSRPYSADQPGQVSSWLCRWATEAAAGQLENEWFMFRSVGRDGVALGAEGGRFYEPGLSALLDDQRTLGRQLARQIERSPLSYFMTMTWSYSQAPKTGPLPKNQRATGGCFWPDYGPCPMHGASDFVIKRGIRK